MDLLHSLAMLQTMTLKHKFSTEKPTETPRDQFSMHNMSNMQMQQFQSSSQRASYSPDALPVAAKSIVRGHGPSRAPGRTAGRSSQVALILQAGWCERSLSRQRSYILTALQAVGPALQKAAHNAPQKVFQMRAAFR